MDFGDCGNYLKMISFPKKGQKGKNNHEND